MSFFVCVQYFVRNCYITGGNSYQTVTIVPSDVNQGGEVSYVILVSQPEVEKVKQPVVNTEDVSVYDFKVSFHRRVDTQLRIVSRIVRVVLFYVVFKFYIPFSKVIVVKFFLSYLI